MEEGANKLGFFAVRGQAYRTDKGVPYGLWSDAFLPALRDMDDASLTVLTRGGEGEGVEGLSPRELEIARLVVGRKSNKAIAKKLGISPRTVSTHLSNVFQKLNLTSRGELADYVRDNEPSSGMLKA